MVDWNGETSGKSSETVSPVTYAFPAASTATAVPMSIEAPPRYVE